VAALEAGLGVKLLNRTTRALALTEAGQAYADRLRGLIDAFDDLAAEVQNAATAPRGRLRLSVPLSFGTIRLAPLLADFAARFPDIALDVQFGDRMVNLVDEGFDAAIRVGQSTDATLVGRRICAARIVTVAAPAYLAAWGTPRQPADLARHDCIIDTNFRDPQSWTFRGGVRARVAGRLSFSNAQACLAAAEAGLGLACLPDFVAAASLAEGRVRAVLSDHENPPLGVHVLYPGGRFLPAKVRVLVDYMVEALRDPA
jgi:DNA-binding transcriptional LysR family regulator